MRRLAAAWLVVVAAFVTLSAAARAQTYGTDLPPGVEAVSIAGANVDGSETPVITTTTPTFSGRLAPGTTEAEFVVMSNPVRWTVAVDPVTGAFETVVPVALEPGTHSLYINDALVGQFVVAPSTSSGAVAELPSTGAGGIAASAGEPLTLALLSLTAVVAASAAGGWLRYRSARAS